MESVVEGCRLASGGRRVLLSKDPSRGEQFPLLVVAEGLGRVPELLEPVLRSRAPFRQLSRREPVAVVGEDPHEAGRALDRYAVRGRVVAHASGRLIDLQDSPSGVEVSTRDPSLVSTVVRSVRLNDVVDD